MKRETHIGKVLKNADPDVEGGAVLRVDDVVYGAELHTEYVPGRYPFAGDDEGFYYSPQEGTLVEVEIAADPDEAVEDLSARWVGQLYGREDAIPEEFRSAPTTRGGIKFGAEVFLQDKTAGLTAIISKKTRLGEEDAAHPLVRGDTFNAQLGTYLDAVKVYLDADVVLSGALLAAAQALANGSGTPADVKAYGAAVAAAWTTYAPAPATLKVAASAFAAARDSWLSTHCKTE